ncbi:MAG: glycoside hydrolase family 99-like domain-containing protein [Candidatus Margulisiibacteriota bacterium]
MSKQQAIIVLGMHRSGTSAFAGTLSLLGCDLGKNIMTPLAENERGFYENESVYQVNERILKKLGSAWDSPFPLPDRWWESETLADCRQALRAVIQSEFSGAGLFVIKDPRICLLLPLWLEALAELAIEPLFIIPLRHPLEVFGSLQKRNGFSPAKSAALWLNYMLEAELRSRGCRRVMVSFNDLLADPSGTISALAAQFGLEFPNELTGALGGVRRFLEPSLKHHDERSQSTDAGDLPYVTASYRALLAMARPDSTGGTEAVLDGIRAEYAAARAEFYFPELAEAVSDLRKEVIAQRNKVGEMELLTHSLSWRLTGPARSAKQGLSRLARLALRLVRWGIGAARRVMEPKPGLALGSAVQQALAARVSLAEIGRQPLEFAAADKPRVSIIIPVHNKLEYTFNCLRAIKERTDERLGYEIIMVDDASTDQTAAVLATVKGLRVLRNQSNRGYLYSCNLAAEHAAGEYLLFLNNDTLVLPGWLDRLLKTFATYPAAGLVGAKFLSPDGRLLEAGGIVWRDGSAANYGRGDDPGRPEYNYAREVDYCSGACVMLPRALFLAVGKYDVNYSPAYYEDVDLAFKVRSAGKKVYYQPNAEIVHFEGVSCGTDTAAGVKRYQLLNREKFVVKWRAALARHGEPGSPLERERDRAVAQRLLVIDETVCLPDQDAGSLRMWHLLKLAGELGYKISFFPHNRYYPADYVRALNDLGVEVLAERYNGRLAGYLRQYGPAFDVVLLSRVSVAEHYIDLVREYCSRARIIFDTVDLHYLRETRGAELSGDPERRRLAGSLKQRELGVALRADVTLVVSRHEQELIEREGLGIRVEVVPTIQEVVGRGAPFGERRDLFFVGGFRHAPNLDAMLYFLKEVWPLVSGKLPGVKLFVIGGNPPPELLALAAERVIIAGQVPDIAPYLERCRLSVAPLRFGAGVKGKINLSMAYGVPVVATPLAAEGMNLTPGEDVLTAERPAEFAAAVTRLYNDELLWHRLSQGGLENVRRHFSPEAARQAVAAVLRNVNAGAAEGEGASGAGTAARLIAFFLPQFHPIPENDKWWGEGFTEWRNVMNARPLFPRHAQPKTPTDLGFYDLRVPEVREKQAALAKQYGLEGFCYWHYWFNGKLLLERPVLEMISSGKPDLPFCLAWANEPWSRRWTGENLDVLQEQAYGGDDDGRRHFAWLLPALRDPRAIKIDGKPVFLIYRADQIPEIKRLIALWRELARESGLPGLYLISIETTGTYGVDPRRWGFDAAVEFQPNWRKCGAVLNERRSWLERLSAKFKRFLFGVQVWDYRRIWPYMLRRQERSYPYYPGVFPRWDNTPRKGRDGLVVEHSSPAQYGSWLKATIAGLADRTPDKRIVFINAWNEWAEGNYLEPDRRYGHAYLEETRRANTGEAGSKPILPATHLKPTFLIIGTQKGGTHALFHYLPQHPLIVPALKKEVCYFCDGNNLAKGDSWYHEHFPLVTSANRDALTFEASVGYLCNPKAAERIRQYNPEMKLIMVLRDPVERVFSQWNMYHNFIGHGEHAELAEQRDFDRVVRDELDAIGQGAPIPRSRPDRVYLPMGLYLEQIENYLKYFPRQQLLILESGRLRRERTRVLDEIVEFLGLPKCKWNEKLLTDRQQGKYRQAKIDPATAKMLAEFYRPYNEALFNFLGGRYDWQ